MENIILVNLFQTIMEGVERLKQEAGVAACNFIKDGMKLGLGTGSTVRYTIIEIGRRISEEGLNVVGVPTSEDTRKLAEQLGIPLVNLSETEGLDLVIDGADEFDSNFALIKGGGGALLQEKIVAESGKVMVVIVDDSKVVTSLGRFPLPIEIIKFGYEFTRKMVLKEIENMGYSDISFDWRKDGKKFFLTDEGHYILDLKLNHIKNPALTHEKIKGVTGVVETGLFINIANKVIVGDEEGNLMEKE